MVHEPAPVRPLLYFEIPAWSIVHLIERRIAPEALEPRPSFSLRGNPEQRRLRVRDASVNGLVDVPRLRLISTYSRTATDAPVSPPRPTAVCNYTQHHQHHKPIF